MRERVTTLPGVKGLFIVVSMLYTESFVICHLPMTNDNLLPFHFRMDEPGHCLETFNDSWRGAVYEV